MPAVYAMPPFDTSLSKRDEFDQRGRGPRVNCIRGILEFRHQFSFRHQTFDSSRQMTWEAYATHFDSMRVKVDLVDPSVIGPPTRTFIIRLTSHRLGVPVVGGTARH